MSGSTPEQSLLDHDVVVIGIFTCLAAGGIWWAVFYEAIELCRKLPRDHRGFGLEGGLEFSVPVAMLVFSIFSPVWGWTRRRIADAQATSRGNGTDNAAGSFSAAFRKWWLIARIGIVDAFTVAFIAPLIVGIAVAFVVARLGPPLMGVLSQVIVDTWVYDGSILFVFLTAGVAAGSLASMALASKARPETLQGWLRVVAIPVFVSLGGMIGLSTVLVMHSIGCLVPLFY